jgi:two-component system CheB/CheR fusion protein
MNGYEVGRRMRAMLPEVLLIALSSWVADESTNPARQAGFDHYLVKPVQLTELQKLMQTRRRRNS